jgi:anti-sigma B factor antagonist
MKPVAIPLQFAVHDAVCGRRHTLILRGELDMMAADCLDAVVCGLLVPGITGISLNIGGLTFIDATGLRALLRLHELCEQKRYEFSITRPRGQVQRLFELTGAADRLPCEAVGGTHAPAVAQIGPVAAIAARGGSR